MTLPNSTPLLRAPRKALAGAAMAAMIMPLPAWAQNSGTSGPQTVQPMTEPDVPDLGDEPKITQPLSPTPETDGDSSEQSIMDDPTEADRSVEVSLGDWDVKNALADELGLRVSEVPLTIEVSPDIARTVCPISGDDLEQQQVISAVSTCAAKRLSPELMEEARSQLASGESNSSAMRDAESATQTDQGEAAASEAAQPSNGSNAQTGGSDASPNGSQAPTNGSGGSGSSGNSGDTGGAAPSGGQHTG